MCKTLKIGPITYQVTADKKLKAAFGRRCGECDPVKARIRLDPRLDLQLQRVTLWHEALHAILFGAGINGDEHNEQHIDALAYGIVALLNDNPDITKDPKLE